MSIAQCLIVAPGFSCRHQIADFCHNRRSLHTAELLAMTGGMMRIRLLSLGLAFGCAPSHPPPATPSPHELVWVVAHYAGGASCQANAGYRPPNTVEVLRQARVPVYATAVEMLLLPDACDSPAYSAAHHALIVKTDSRRAARAGYEPGIPRSGVRVDTLQRAVLEAQ